MLGAIVLATTPNEFDSEKPTSNDETATPHANTTPKSNNSSTSDVKCLPSTAVTTTALQTPTTETTAPVILRSAVLPNIFYSNPRPRTSTWSAITTAGYFTAILLLTAAYISLLSRMGLEQHPATIFTSDRKSVV